VFNPHLDELVEWLKQRRVETVALESTGVLWIPLFQKLEAAGIETLLVNTKKLKHVPGRKSDVLDCQWIQQLHSYGLLNGSFRPEDLICQMRTYVRQRDSLVKAAAEEIQHMQKALTQMGVHLHVVLGDITGVSGLAIMDAILGGQRDPEELVKLRDHRVRRSTVEEMKNALQGQWREELLFVLHQSRGTYQHFQQQIEELDLKLYGLMEQILQESQRKQKVPAEAQNSPATSQQSCQQEPGSKSIGRRAAGRKKAKAKGGNTPVLDFGPQLKGIYGTDLTLLPGLNVLGVLVLLSEIGTDMSRWRSPEAFVAWLGLCPGVKISGGKRLSNKTPEVVSRVSTLLRVAAMAVGRTESCLGSFYRRIQAKRGSPKAITATARKLAVLIYTLVKEGKQYQEPDRQAYEAKVLRFRLARIRKQADQLGYQLVPKDELAA
jgi:transposase